MNRNSQNRVIKKSSTTEKPSPKYRNPFINFMQEFRKKNAGLTAQEAMQRAAEAWRRMSDAEKAPYQEMARKAPRRRRRRKGRQRRRQRSHSAHSSASQSN